MPGTHIGAYEVVSLMGAGGMGEVYRGRDTKLDRNVAIKVLPETFASDPERIARFQREARTLASLNHPHIGAIYGLEESNGVKALVLELVEGPTLADRIAQGPIPLDEALPIARQIAEALEAAHEHGIIHRDLKPANIKIKSDGTVKVLDFGLAKAVEGSSVRTDLSASPTITSPANTVGGMILGTAGYMSPEQARGKLVDKRADIWAFGCVLFEMLTAQRAFADEDVSLTLSKVLQREPDFEAMPSSVPARVSQVLRVCLRKDPKQRAGDIRDVRLALDGAFESPVEQGHDRAVGRSASSRLWIAVAALSGAVAVILSALHFRGVPLYQQTLRYQLSNPASEPIASIALSPDGRQLAFITGRLGNPTSTNLNRLWLRSLDMLEAEPVKGSEGAMGPFWSPDSRTIGFFADGKLKRVDLVGGTPQVVCDAPSLTSGAWNREGVILFASAGNSLSEGGPVYQVSVSVGNTQPATVLDESRKEVVHLFPEFLPDSRHFLYTAVSSIPENSAIYAASLDSKDTKRLLSSATNVRYAEDATGQGYLLFARGDRLLAHRFDAPRLEIQGEAFSVVQGISALPLYEWLLGQFSSSASGLLTYLRGANDKELVWLDRLGRRVSTIGEPGDYSNLALSPDEKRLALSRMDLRFNSRDIWIFDLDRGVPTKVTFDPGDDVNPVWSPDGQHIAFSSARNGPRDLYVRSVNGTGEDEVLFESRDEKSVADWSPDGRYVVTSRFVLPFEGKRQPIAFPPGIGSPRVSPNGRWLAYESNESGRLEVYVQSFQELLSDKSARKWLVSTTGGNYAEWRRDGQELFYIAPDNRLMALSVKTSGPTFERALPKPLFALRLEPVIRRTHYQPASNGERFLVAQVPERLASSPITVVVNWAAELRR